MSDLISFLDRHIFELVMIFALFSIRGAIRAHGGQSATLRSLGNEIKGHLEKINWSIKEIFDHLEPVVRDRKIEIDLRDGKIELWQAKILRGGQ